jgi:predicted dehydrogenase
MVRIGILGAARIVSMALLRPAAEVPEVKVVAVAARDGARARTFAQKHGIPRAHDSYRALLADPEVDAIYNPLPNSLHCEWTLAALAAGKHVLCEKPFTSNTAEAERIAANTRGLVVMEAFHYRYHPLAERLREISLGGAIGRLRHIEVSLCFPFLLPGDIRFRYELGGGATMDLGSYTIHLLRHWGGGEPTVVSAHAKLSSPKVDRAMRAELRFPGGHTGRIHCSLFSSSLFRMGVRIEGTEGEVSVFNPLAPQYLHWLTLRTPSGTRRDRVRGASTYVCQLRAFAAAVQRGEAVLTSPADSIANMRVIDAVYRAAGLPLRGE